MIITWFTICNDTVVYSMAMDVPWYMRWSIYGCRLDFALMEYRCFLYSLITRTSDLCSQVPGNRCFSLIMSSSAVISIKHWNRHYSSFSHVDWPVWLMQIHGSLAMFCCEFITIFIIVYMDIHCLKLCAWLVHSLASWLLTVSVVSWYDPRCEYLHQGVVLAITPCHHVDVFVQDCNISGTFAMEILQYGTKLLLQNCSISSALAMEILKS